MGNLCSSCFKTRDESQTNDNYNTTGLTNSQRSITSSVDDERTPLIGKSDGQNHLSHQSSNGDSSTIAPLPPPPSVITETRTDLSNVPANETAETKMAIIVEGMLSKLIDVGSGGSNLPQTNNNSNSQNEQLVYSLNKSLLSTNISSLPDAGINSLPSLLSGRPISSDICHFVAHTAGELSRLLIDEIKIIHKEDLVVVFE